MEGLHRLAHGRHRGNRLLYCRGPDLARFGDILRSVCDRTGNKESYAGRHHATSDAGMDGTGWAQPDRFRIRLASEPPLSVARPRYEVLCQLSLHSPGWRRAPAPPSCPLSESECVCRAMGSICQTGVPVEADLARRILASKSSGSIHHTL